MRVALDTNRYVDLCKGVDETVAILDCGLDGVHVESAAPQVLDSGS